MDHESLKWPSNQKELIGRKASWAQILQEFDLQLCYQKGKFNIVANALSCMPMVNELSFTTFKSSLLESLKGLCEHDKVILTFGGVFNVKVNKCNRQIPH